MNRSIMSKFQAISVILDKVCAVVPKQKVMLRQVYILVYYGSSHHSYTLANRIILSTLILFRAQLRRLPPKKPHRSQII